MKIELMIIGITIFFLMNTYYDGKYVNLLKSWKKYYQMAGIAFAGLSIYLLFKRNPNGGRSLLSSASSVLKMLPIDKNSKDLMTPFFERTSINNGFNDRLRENKILNSGKTGTKRSVSETKKKYVAANQGWKCGSCKKQLPAWFEVDHKVRLEHGGSNHVDNLEALCRDCHGEKTALENL